MKTKDNKNNNLTIVLSVATGLLLVALAFGSKTTSGLLSGADFMSKYQSTPNAVLVDVRRPDEFGISHIAGAIDIDFENSNFVSEVQRLDTSKTYFIYCRSGNRSGQASVIMRQNGIKNLYELQGGISTNPQLLNS